MFHIRRSRPRPLRRPPKPRVRLEVEFLEHRNLPTTGGFGLTTLVQVSDPSPLPAPTSTSPTVFVNSEVEPQIAVDPTNQAHAVSIWQQDRYRSVGGARALVVSVTNNGNDPTSTWSAPTPIPYFDATDPLGSAFARYTDPWVTIGPDGIIYAAALGLTPAGPVPGHTAVLVSTSTDGGFHWSAPATLIETTAPGGLPIDQANDKEMIVADPKHSDIAYVVWDQIDFPSDTASFDALHAGAADRENLFFAKTIDGGAHWTTAQNITNFLDLKAASGNELVVEPDGSLVDVCTLFKGSGTQPAQADKITLATLRSTDGGNTWSTPVIGPGVEAMPVTDPDTGAPVRDGEQLLSVTTDPSNGNIYAVWADGRFSNFTHEDIAFSISKDGGQTWSDPIKVNQTPTNIPAGDQQAFTPNVAVNSDGTVAVTYYDFRNNTDPTPGSGLPTDYFIVHNVGDPGSSGSWTGNEQQLTTSSFNMENAAPTSRGYFLGDYQGLAAAGENFYALFAQAGANSSDPSNIWFRDPPPAPGLAGDLVASLKQETTAYLFTSGVPAGDLAFLIAGRPDTPGANFGNGPGSVHSGSDLETQPGDILLDSFNLAIDSLFANSGDTLFSGALGSDVASVSVD
jgi:hypothetical protein